MLLFQTMRYQDKPLFYEAFLETNEVLKISHHEGAPGVSVGQASELLISAQDLRFLSSRPTGVHTPALAPGIPLKKRQATNSLEIPHTLISLCLRSALSFCFNCPWDPPFPVITPGVV